MMDAYAIKAAAAETLKLLADEKDWYHTVEPIDWDAKSGKGEKCPEQRRDRVAYAKWLLLKIRDTIKTGKTADAMRELYKAQTLLWVADACTRTQLDTVNEQAKNASPFLQFRCAID